MTVKDIFNGFQLMLKDDGSGRQFKINLLLLVYTIGNIISAYTVLTLFEMNSPLCWDSVLIGYFNSSTMLAKCAAMLLTTCLLKRYIGDEWLLVASKISVFVEDLFLIFVTNTGMMFISK
jgi:PCFT/HCP family folate transporter-like MFS transporter 1/3